MTRLIRYLRTWVIASVILLLMTAIGTAVGPDRAGWETGTLTVDLTSYYDANSLLMFVDNTGSFAYDKTASLGKNDGLYFPRTTNKTVMYAAGIWIGAKANGETRVSVAEYSDEFVPGPMLGGTFQPDNPAFKVYKITQGDSRLSNPDYADWPYDQGAPVVKNHAGNDSIGADGYRIPLLQGKQALWTVFNDANPAAHTNGAGTTAPLGVEVQLYVYGSDLSCELNQAVFLRWTIANKGSNSLESTYVSLWGDPDLGSAGDDLVGCDTILSLGYCYNAGPDVVYGAAPPSVGFGLLQGPIVPSPGDSAWLSRRGAWLPDFRNLPMTAFSRYINGNDPGSALESYNYMRGLDQTGAPVINPATGLPTTFMFSGDRPTGTGWLDNSPSDRRFMLTTGPFTMAPGDTQEVVAAVLVGAGTSAIFIYDTIQAVRTVGTSVGSAFALVLDPLSTTGHDYRINFQVRPDSTEFTWSVKDLSANLVVVSDQTNQSGNEYYPTFDGLMVKVICPLGGVGGWDIPGGIRRFSWIGADGFHFEGFNGAIGWESPHHLLGGGPPGVPPLKIKNVMLKLATVDGDGNFNPDDPNVSYAYRYGRSFSDTPAKPEFAPFIINPTGGYSYQDFSKSVPLSAWNMDANPPRRLAVGHLENNTPAGMVDGKYWPPNGYAIDNTASDGPREWLWIFDTDYSETPNPAFEIEAIWNPLPIMYFLTSARDGDVPFATGDQFLIIRRTDYNTEQDVFEFTSPPPSSLTWPDIGVCYPAVASSSITELKRVDSLILVSVLKNCLFPIVVTTLNNSGVGSLRSAIEAANTHAGPDTITFSIAGTIWLTSPLPAISDAGGGTVILGFTAPGASPPMTPTVILDGSSSTPGPGLELASPNNRVEGLTFRSFAGPGIAVTEVSSLGNTITACRFYANAGPGVDLGNDGITPNDPTDDDTGPNTLLNYPFFDSILEVGIDTFAVYGRATISSQVELFLAAEAGNPGRQPEPTIHGPAYMLLGSTIAAGDGYFSFPSIAMPEWSLVTATATDPAGNTSELALNKMLTPDPLRITAYSEPVPPVRGVLAMPLTSPTMQVVVFSPPNALGKRDTIGPPPMWPNTFGPRATYDSLTDHNSGGIVDTRVKIVSPDSGEYQIKYVLIGDPENYLTGIGVDGHAEVKRAVSFVTPGQVIDTTYHLAPPTRGELNGDGVIDVFDVIASIDMTFSGAPMPDPPELADVNCDGVPDVFDVIYLIDYTFSGGAAPCR